MKRFGTGATKMGKGLYRLGLGMALVGLACAPAQAVCAVCNAQIVLSEPLASCLDGRIADEIAALGASGAPVRLIDLSDCTSRGSLPLDPSSAALTIAPDTSFILDEAGLVCLRDLIAQAPDPFGPSRVFDLGALCP